MRSLLPILFVLLLAVGVSAQPQSPVDREAASGPMSAYSQIIHRGPADTYSCPYEYCNSFEEIGCANELGEPEANAATGTGAVNCEDDNGVTQGFQSLQTVGAPGYLSIDEAYDPTGEPTVYYQWSYYTTTGSSGAVWNDSFFPLDVDEGALYPRVQQIGVGAGSRVRLRCDAAVYSSEVALSDSTQFYFQMEQTWESSTAQWLRVYDANMLHVESVTCTSAGAVSKPRGLSVGEHGIVVTGVFRYDGVYVNFSRPEDETWGIFPKYWLQSYESTAPPNDCSFEGGSPGASVSLFDTPQKLDCHELTLGKTHGNHSMEATWPTDAQHKLQNGGAVLDFTEQDKVYVELDWIFVQGGMLFNSNLFWPNTGSPTSVPQYPWLTVSLVAADQDTLQFRCAPLSAVQWYDATPGEGPQRSTQYTIQVDVNQASGTAQYVRVYTTADGLLQWSNSCTSSVVTTFKGIGTGVEATPFGQSIQEAWDNVQIQNYYMGAP
jgi:hypothetical protein